MCGKYWAKFLLALILVPALIYAAWAGAEFIAHRAELARWSPEKAAVEARSDIAAGALKIYLHGSYAAYKVGVGEEDRPLVAHLPTFDAGVGCIVKYDDVFDAQREYAVRYNQAIVRYQSGQPTRTANPG